jgi:hypothetical protein
MGAPRVLANVGSTPVAVTAGTTGFQVTAGLAPGQNGPFSVYDQNQNLLQVVQGAGSTYQWAAPASGDPFFPGQVVGFVSVASGAATILVTDSGAVPYQTPQSGGAFPSAGAITQKSGRAFLTGAAATAYTLAAPIPGVDDFKLLEITDTTGNAHTITTPVNGFNKTQNIATYNGTIGTVLALRAYQGSWYASASTSVTLSGT